MSKVITFSRVFPAYHPKKGQPTHFVEKISEWIYDTYPGVDSIYDLIASCNPTVFVDDFIASLNPDIREYKNHTIRAGNRFKVGDKFSPRVWSGKPYNSKQITIAPDIEIKKVWSFIIHEGFVYIGGSRLLLADLGKTMSTLATNDGLSYKDFVDWFQYPKNFEGQIICWNESVNY